MHIYVDISAHGLGHLAQTAPVIASLRALEPALQLTIASGLQRAQLARRIAEPFAHIAQASDFGFAMHNAIDIDFAASGARYRAAHVDWAQRVAQYADRLRAVHADLVLANAAYLPLAAAAHAGLPGVGLCSLNWADLFWHYFGGNVAIDHWAALIHAQMLAAYRAAKVFLRVTPGMPMLDLANTCAVGPIATLSQRDPAQVRAELARELDLPADERWVLVAMGGMALRLPIERWPRRAGIHWLCAADWPVQRPDVRAFDPAAHPFTDLLAACDAVLTKPGYGTFVESACHGVPLLYLPRDNWPEEAPLVDWMQQHARIACVSRTQAETGDFATALDALWQGVRPPLPKPCGAQEAAAMILELARRH